MKFSKVLVSLLIISCPILYPSFTNHALAADSECVAEEWIENDSWCQIIQNETLQVSYVECKPFPSLGYGTVKGSVSEGTIRSDTKVSPTIPCLATRG